MTQAALEIEPGSLVASRFRILRCLGHGSSGSVYLCIDRRRRGRPLALKVLPAKMVQNPNTLAIFNRETSVGSRIKHTYVVRSFDTIINPEYVAFTMEYMDGGNLADYLAAHGPLAVPTALRLLCELCSGVEALHRAAIVHHDIKPANILLSAGFKAKISDFGTSRDQTNASSSSGRSIFGTACYISPEYLKDGVSDVRCDIYAIGVVGYEMLAGQHPFKGKNFLETITSRFHHNPKPLHLLRADCPLSLSRVIAKAMAREAEERFPTIKALQQALRAVKRQLPKQ